MDSLSEYIFVVVVEDVGETETEGWEYMLVRVDINAVGVGRHKPGVRVETFSQKLWW